MNKSSLIKVGIIGAGNIVRSAHISNFSNYKYPAEVVAICGRDKDRTEAVAKEFNIKKTFLNVDEMLSECDLDVVSVCTPNNMHAEGVIKSLEAHCNVLCEKPPAINFAEAQKMLEKSKEADRFLAYHLPYRQLKEVQLLKQFINAGDLGKVYHIKATFIRRRGIPNWGNFTNKEIQGGGALIDIGIHVLDLALYLLDFPEPQSALGSMYDHIGKNEVKDFTVEDSCFAHINFKNGSSLTIESAFALNMESDRRFNLEVYGSKAGATLLPLKIFNAEGEDIKKGFPVTEKVDLHKQNIHLFLDRCLGEVTNVCSAEEGATLQNIIEMVYASAEARRSN